MPTYEYECKKCSLQCERQQSIIEKPLVECPECNGQEHRLVSGGIGFMVGDGKSQNKVQKEHGCSLEQTGKTCCGCEICCDIPHCEEQ